MKLDQNCALLVIDIQQEDFMEMNESNINEPQWDVIRNGRRVLDVFRAKKLPVIQIKECHRPDMVDFGRELDGSEGIHCVENRPENDYAQLTYPIEGEYLISKRRYFGSFSTSAVKSIVCSSFCVDNSTGSVSQINCFSDASV